jgi:hypothetical protein
MSLLKNRNVRKLAFVISAVVGGVVLTAGVVTAATTISTNIQTDGTLSVTGTSTLTGNAYFLQTIELGATSTPTFTDGSTAGLLLDGNLLTSEALEIHNNYAEGIDVYTHASSASWRAPELNLWRSGGSQSAPTAVVSGYQLGYFEFGGYDGSEYGSSAIIQANADGNWSPTSYPTSLDLEVTPSGSTNQIDAIHITNSANVGINDSAPGTRLSVLGNAQIGFSSGQTSPSNGLVVKGNTGVGTSTPVANFQVANGSNATTTMEIGSVGQNKGSCLKLYRTDGSAIYAYVAAGATTFTLTTIACANVSNF